MSACRDFLGGQGLRLPASSAGGAGSVLGQPTKIPPATRAVDR